MEHITPFSLNFSGVLLMLSLGIRHGIDPDHIAIIDGMTMRHASLNSPIAKWVGTLFAIGHGLVVTIISVLVALISGKLDIPIWLMAIAEWIPIALLLLLGFLNLKSLLIKEPHKIVGWRTKLLPNKLKNSTNPLSIILIGVLFATVFDTASQAAAWGYAASLRGGILASVIMGLVFSAGMIVIDTIDGRVLYSILNKKTNQSLITNYRKWIGWAIVIMSFTIALYKITITFFPIVQLGYYANTLVGLIFIAFVVSIYVVTLFKNIKTTVT